MEREIATLDIPHETRLGEEALEAAGEAVRGAMAGRAYTMQVTFRVEHRAQGEPQARSIHARARSSEGDAVSVHQDARRTRLRAQASGRRAQALLGRLAGALMEGRARAARRDAAQERRAEEGATSTPARAPGAPRRTGLDALLEEARADRGGHGTGVALGRAWEQGLRQAWEAGAGGDAAHPMHTLLEQAWGVLEHKARAGRRMWQCGPRHAAERRNAGRWMGWIARRDPAKLERLWAAIDAHAAASAEHTVLTLEAAQELMDGGEEARAQAGKRACAALAAAGRREDPLGRSEREQVGASVQDLIARASAAEAQGVLEQLETGLAAPEAQRAVGDGRIDGLRVYAMRGGARRAQRGEAATWDAIVALAAASAHPTETVGMVLRTRTEPRLDAVQAQRLVEALERGPREPPSAAARAALEQISRRLARSVHGTAPEDKRRLAARARQALERQQPVPAHRNATGPTSLCAAGASQPTRGD